jgi:hypothetical protein
MREDAWSLGSANTGSGGYLGSQIRAGRLPVPKTNPAWADLVGCENGKALAPAFQLGGKEFIIIACGHTEE